MDTMHDRIVVQAVLEGKADAYRSLVDLYRADLVRYVYGLVGDEEAAHDIAQEAFTKAYRRLRLLNAKAAFAPWLYGIARQLAHEDMKLNAPWVLYDGQATGAAAEPQVVSDAICRAMSRLRPEWRSVVQLYYWDDKTYEEIAELLGTKPGTVRLWLSRAQAALRSELVCEDDKEVSQRLIRGRPRLRFSSALTPRVMQDVRGTRPRRFVPWRKLALVAVVLLVVCGVGAGALTYAKQQAGISIVNSVLDTSSTAPSGGKQSIGTKVPDYSGLATNAQNDIDAMSLQTGKLSDADYADTQFSDVGIY